METHFILDERGEPVVAADLDHWASWLETAYLGVARSIVTPDVVVVTMFVPVHVGEEAEAPLPFVTCIFGGILDGDERRSSSRIEALATHHSVVEWCRTGEALEKATSLDNAA